MRYTDEIPVYMTFEETSLELDSVILFHPKKTLYHYDIWCNLLVGTNSFIHKIIYLTTFLFHNRVWLDDQSETKLKREDGLKIIHEFGCKYN